MLEKLARVMMAKDPKLKAEFERKVASDPKFEGDPYARLEFFYDRSPWHDPLLGTLSGRQADEAGGSAGREVKP